MIENFEFYQKDEGFNRFLVYITKQETSKMIRKFPPIN